MKNIKLHLSIVSFMLLFMLTNTSAQTVIAQWNSYTSGNPPANGQFLTTAGTALNQSAVLTRDAAGTTYTVNADGVAASRGWVNATSQEKYWIATFNTTGYENLKVTSKQMGSASGPKDFKLQYCVGAGSWTDVPGGGNIVVSDVNYLTGTVGNLGLPVAMENQSSVSLRWLCTSTVSINNGTVGTTGVNRLDVVVTGDAMQGVSDPKIIISKNSLEFTATNQEESFTVSGESLTGNISITSSNPSLFLVDPVSLPANASNRVVKVLFAGSISAKATLTLTGGSAWAKTVTLIAKMGNDGSKNSPYTVTECQTNQDAGYHWVQGYIIGTNTSGATTFKPEFQPGAFTSNTNILIAESPNETTKEKIVPVQLPAGAVRNALNLIDNPGNHGEYVKIEGTLEAYFGIPGLRNARAYEFISPPEIEEPELPDGLIPVGYYNPINGKQERTLKTSLHKILKEHTVLKYSNLWYYFRTTDVKPDGSVWDMYSDVVNYYDPNSTNSSVPNMDREHSLPKSWWDTSPENEKYAAYSDLHHLCPAERYANIAKSNNIMGKTGSSLSFNNGVTKVGPNVFPGTAIDVKAFEPADEYKGDFARAYMYVVTCYEDYAPQWRAESSWMLNNETYPVFKDWTKEMLLKWHLEDPVSEKEVNRNEEVYYYQSNRNPFIDFPQLAEYIWGDSVSYTFTVPEKYFAIRPTLISPVNLSEIFFGETENNSQLSQTIILRGLNLTENVSVSVWGGDKGYFSVASGYVPENDVNSEEGYDLEIFYNPAEYGEHQTTLLIQCEGINGQGSSIVCLKGICTAEDATAVCRPVNTQALDLYVQNGVINFKSRTSGDKIFIYDLMGRICYQGIGSGNWQTFQCPTSGLYIIRCNGKSQKIINN